MRFCNNTTTHEVPHTSPTEDLNAVTDVVIDGTPVAVVKLFGFLL